MLKLMDLAKRPDFHVGPLLVSPSRRLVEGPAGQSHVEPLVMQALLLLLDAKGEVVTRQELFDQVWGGVMVGDDSLNRAISGVRRIAAETGPELFEIETVPRTGYRLTIKGSHPGAEADQGATTAATQPRFTRRSAAIGAVAAAAVAAGGLGLWSVRAREDRRFNELIERGVEALEYSDPSADAGQFFQRAVAMRPDNARAQGLFAYARAMRADNAEPSKIGTSLQEAERAVRAAFAFDPGEPNAHLAQVILQQSMLDFASTEDRVRGILKKDPGSFGAMRILWGLLQSTGRSRDALALIERAFAMKPLAAGTNYPRAQLLWILGRNAEADRVIDTAMQYWPSHRFVRFARFSIFAYTGRPRAALAMLDNDETRPQSYSPEAVALWRVSLEALDQRTPVSIAAARRANLDAARRDLRLSGQAVSVLSALGEVDAAFEITDALFAVRPPANLHPQSAGKRSPAKSTAWRFAPWLFTPPTAPMRADPRFDDICQAIGLTEYWAKRRIKPDYQLGIT